MGQKNRALKGDFQPQNGLKSKGSLMEKVGQQVGKYGYTVAKLFVKKKTDTDEMSTHNRAPAIISTQKPHRNGLVSQLASGSGLGGKRRQSPETDELAEEGNSHPKRQRHTQEPRSSPRVDVAALESMRDRATANRDADEVRRITDKLEGKNSSSRTYQQSQKRALERVDSDDELNATPPTKGTRSSGGTRTSVKEQGSPLSHKTSKGDMVKTTFKGAKCPEITISRAASGKFRFDAKQSGEILRLRLREKGTFSLIPVNKSGEQVELDHQWLTLILGECHRARFSPDSPHLLFDRPSKRGSPAQLLLEISSITDAVAAIKWLENGKESLNLSSLKLENPPALQLQKTFDHLFQNSAPSTSPDQRRPGDLEAHSPNSAGILAQQDKSRGLDPRLCRQAQPSSPPLAQMAGPSGHVSLKDRMKGDAGSPTYAASPRSSLEAPRSHRLERRTRVRLGTPPPMAPISKRWVDEHPDWAKIWDKEPLIYPANGKNRAQVTKDDILRLEEGECLNDNIIVFYLRYLQSRLERESVGWSERILFMNPWFYERLSQRKSRGVDYDAVKSWTAKVDLLSKDYIIVPVNEAAHWYLAIICNPGKLLPAAAVDQDATSPADTEDEASPEEKEEKPTDTTLNADDGSEDEIRLVVSDIAPDNSSRHSKASITKKDQRRKLNGPVHRPSDPGDARVITLDSLGSTHSPTCTNLRDYLVQEIKHRRNIDIETPVRFGLTAKGIPAQDDYTSCGVYLLAYVERFLKQPDQVISEIVSKVDLGWSDINPVSMRGEIRDLIMGLRREQNAQREKEKQAKKDAKAAKVAKKKQGAEPVDSPPVSTPQTPGTIDPSDATQDYKTSRSDLPSSGKAGILPAADSKDTGQLPIEQGISDPTEPVQSLTGSMKSPGSGPPVTQAVEPLIDSSEVEETVTGFTKVLLPPIRTSTPATPKTPKRKRSIDELAWSVTGSNIVRGDGASRDIHSDGEGPSSHVPETLSYLSSPSGTQRGSAGRPPKKLKKDEHKMDDGPVTVTIDDSPKSQKKSEERTTSHHFAEQPAAARRLRHMRASPDKPPPRGDDEKKIVYGGTGRRPAHGSRIAQDRSRPSGNPSIIAVDGKNIDLTNED